MSRPRQRRRAERPSTSVARADRAASGGGLTPERELALLQELTAFVARSRAARDAEKSLRSALRLAMDFFDAGEGCVVTRMPGAPEAAMLFGVPRAIDLDLGTATSFIEGDKVQLPDDLMLARVRRRGRRWGALVVRSPGSIFRWEHRRAFSTVAATATEIMERIDLERIRDVRARIDRKIMEKVRPKDLFYQILDGIRSLTSYDHSAALLICDEQQQFLEVVAEQIAWRKGKSRAIGRVLPLSPTVRTLLADEVVYGFRGCPGAWDEIHGRPAGELAELIDQAEADGPPEGVILCAPLVSRDWPLGVLRVASRHREALDEYEAELISRFLPQASVAIQNSQRAESLERQMLSAERRNAMAVLARGVSHDVNNALGAVLPLVQELRAEATDGTLDPAVLGDDLREIEMSVQVCRRIFGGMLRFARGGARHVGPVHLAEAIRCTLDILREGLARREITVVTDVAADLPAIRGLQSEIEQLLLNLLTNAGDATPPGGRIEILARPLDDQIELVIQDTGTGIPPELLSRIREPFFTTKRTGSGLGLAICRSIISQMRGRFDIANAPGGGTRVTILLAADTGAAP